MSLENQLLQERQRMQVLHEKAKRSLIGAPEGSLRLGKSQGCTQYFHCSEATRPSGKYIPKGDMELAKKLAQKAYDEKILKLTTKRLRQLDSIIKDYCDDEIAQVFLGEHQERQKLIVPVEELYQQKLDRWMSKIYIGKGFGTEDPVIISDKGLRVRSKSERFMANYFDSLGLQYKYECPLILNPYGPVYPDFTFLSRKTGGEIYWEHEGMMDNPEYARNATKKIELYEKNGIFPGKNLIITFETSTQILDKKILELLVKQYL